MPEGDTIHFLARRMGSVLVGRVPAAIEAPQRRHSLARWPERLGGRRVLSVRAYGKHLFIDFEGELVIHSHLRMSGRWGIFRVERRMPRPARRVWLVMRTDDHEVVQYGGPVLELRDKTELRSDPRLMRLGPDILAERFDVNRFLRLLRRDDPTRGIGDAILDQRLVAGIGNIWKSESLHDVGVDPWRPVEGVSDTEVVAIAEAAHRLMQRSVERGGWTRNLNAYGRARRPCPRCRGPIMSKDQGDANRRTYWCPVCQR